jgi:hypothetical protein
MTGSYAIDALKRWGGVEAFFTGVHDAADAAEPACAASITPAPAHNVASTAKKARTVFDRGARCTLNSVSSPVAGSTTVTVQERATVDG